MTRILVEAVRGASPPSDTGNVTVPVKVAADAMAVAHDSRIAALVCRSIQLERFI
jgi:hypothetical protein